MSDLLDDLVTYLTVTLDGTVCYRDTMLDMPDTAAAVYEYPGESYAPQVAGASRSVQVVFRSKSPTTAKEGARQIYNTLVTENGILNLTANRWTVVELRQPPFKLKIDEKERTYYCFNVGFITYND